MNNSCTGDTNDPVSRRILAHNAITAREVCAMTTKVAISVSAAADQLSVGSRSIYRAIANGSLPHLRFGKRIVIPVEALAAYARDAYPGRRDGNGGQREDAAK